MVAALSGEIPAALRARHTAGLSIALVDGDRTVWARGFGWADRAGGVPVTADTLFHIGSSAKTMTAAAVMQLVEQGRVDLDAPLSRYVPEFSLLPRFPGSTITVRSVLDMHSGIPGDINNGLISVGGPIRGYRGWLLGALRREFPERRVDTAWAYSNSGFVLLQNLVENVTGQDFDAYTREHLFDPMGMPSTTFDDASVPDAALSRGYEAVTGANGAVRVRVRPREYVNGRGGGVGGVVGHRHGRLPEDDDRARRRAGRPDPRRLQRAGDDHPADPATAGHRDLPGRAGLVCR